MRLLPVPTFLPSAIDIESDVTPWRRNESAGAAGAREKASATVAAAATKSTCLCILLRNTSRNTLECAPEFSCCQVAGLRHTAKAPSSQHARRIVQMDHSCSRKGGLGGRAPNHAPRAASLVRRSPCRVWGLDRDSRDLGKKHSFRFAFPTLEFADSRIRRLYM